MIYISHICSSIITVSFGDCFGTQRISFGGEKQMGLFILLLGAYGFNISIILRLFLFLLINRV